MPGIFWVVPAAGVAAIVFAILLARDVLKRSPGTPEMARIGGMIFEGAWAFLKRQYTTIGRLSIIIAIAVGALVGDTVGDPFKDTAGPSLHVLVKLLSTITLVMGPLFI